MKKTKNAPPYKLFGILFLLIMVIVVVNNLRKKTEAVLLSVPDNAGVTSLETAGPRLVAVFKDGQIAVWEWTNLTKPQADFALDTDRVVLPNADQLAAVSETGKKMLSVHNLLTGEKIKDITVGWEDQELWPRISFDKKVVAMVCKNPAGAAGDVVYEFFTVDSEKRLTGVPVSITLSADNETLIDFAVDADGVLYAAGRRDQTGRIIALNLQTGQTVWDQTVDRTDEFCGVIVSPDNESLLAGNRNGKLYKLNTQTGDLLKDILLLEPGETRPITNDYSVLNLAFSPDGQYYVATINPKVYLLKTESDQVFHTCTPADRLVSEVAFSPDSQYFATSDIRQGYPIKIWPLPDSGNSR